VIFHALERLIQYELGVLQDGGVGDDDVQTSGGVLDLFHGLTVVGFVGRDELDDVELALILASELFQSRCRIRVTDTSEDDNVLANNEMLNKSKTYV
jgi:hypothetical protein